MTVILGLNAFHADAAACLLVDGTLVAAVAEERLGPRIKHFCGFPALALSRVLRMGGVEMKDVDIVSIGHDHDANAWHKAAYVLRHPVRAYASLRAHVARRRKIADMRTLISEACGVRRDECRFRLLSVEHHLAHIASAYFASPFDRAAALSYDAAGDFVSTMTAVCEGPDIRVLDRVFLPDSLGYLYTTLCQLIGFDRFGEEYKVMGLSAYGTPGMLGVMEEIAPADSHGRFHLHPRYFDVMKGVSHESLVDDRGEIVLPPFYTPALIDRLGPPRKRDDPIQARDKDLACSCQRRFEGLTLSCLRWLHERIGGDALVAAGGCALNGVCNARILRETPFRRSYIQCAASDDGTAVGAALYAWNVHLKGRRTPVLDTAYYGPQYDELSIRRDLDAAGLDGERLEREPLLERVATLLAEGRIVGWYQGRSEWGPRALGNRSILAHPGWPGMKDLINRKIKRRESFRPFAPTILYEAVPDYFEQTIESPFMMHVVKIKPSRREALAAVCHEDHTGRLHTLRREQNPLYYDLIRAFERRTGVPVLLNTSFNENEPIVDTPDQAIRCFQRNDIDALCLGSFVVTKPGRDCPAS